MTGRTSTLRTLVTFALLAIVSIASAAKVTYTDSWGNQGLTLESSDFSGVTLNYSIKDLFLDKKNINGEELDVIGLTGNFLPTDEGMPNLPNHSRSLIVPEGAEVRITILEQRVETLKDLDIAPSPRIPFENEEGPLEYKKDMKVYSKNAFYPEQPVMISEVDQLRGVDVVTVGVTPFQYNPQTKELQVIRDIKLRVDFIGGRGTYGENDKRSRLFDRIIKASTMNGNMLPEMDYSKRYASIPKEDGENYEYVIICPDDPTFIQWANVIKEWRNKQGIRTGVFTTTEIGGNTTSAIYDFMDEMWSWELKPEAFLMLGDYGTSGNTITSPVWDGYCISDHLFADVEGSDMMAEMAYARITARNAAELELMINKFIDYETNPPTSQNFYDNPITALGYQTERWFQICSETVNGFWEHALGKEPVRVNCVYSGTPGTWSTAQNTPTVLNYFGPNGLGYIPANMNHLTNWSGNAAQVNAAVNSGAFMLQHRDHGYEQGWGEPDYSSSDLSGLSNEDLTYVFSINCLTGKFNISGESFAEAFHRHEQGALGLIAATEVSYSFVNDTYVWGMYDLMWPNFMPDYGEPGPKTVLPAFANVAGKVFLKNSNWPYNTNNKAVTYYLFHHHGGAYSTVYTEMPQDLTVNHQNALLSGTSFFNIAADEDALIGLSVNGELIGMGIGTGSTTPITVEPQLPGNELTIVVTKQDYYRYETSVQIVPPSGPYNVLNSYNVVDNNNGEADYGETIGLDIVLENVGSEVSNNVTAVLSSTSPYVAEIGDDTAAIASIAAASTATLSDAFEVTFVDVIEDGTDVSFTLTITDDADETYESTFTIPVNAPAFEYGVTFSPAGTIQAGDTVQFTYEIENTGHAAATGVEATLSVTNGVNAAISPATVTIGEIAAQSSENAVFEIEFDSSIPVGSLASFELSFTGNQQVAGTFENSVTVGVTDSFENGFNTNAWVMSGNADWVIDGTTAHSGSSSAKSGTISHDQESEMSLTVDIQSQPASVNFFYKVSSENNYDYLKFYVDGAEQVEWCGEIGWTEYSLPLTNGTHTLKWAYEKDGSVSNGSDCGWIDHLIISGMAPSVDNDPPVVSSLEGTSVTLNTAMELTLDVTDASGVASIDGMYDIGAGWVSFDMDPTDDTFTYTGTIPAQASATTGVVKFEMEDTAGNSGTSDEYDIEWTDTETDAPEVVSITGTSVGVNEQMDINVEFYDATGIDEVIAHYTLDGTTWLEETLTLNPVVKDVVKRAIKSEFNDNAVDASYTATLTISAQSDETTGELYFEMTDTVVPANSGNSDNYTIVWTDMQPWDLTKEFDAETPHGMPSSAGVEFDGTNYLTTKWNGSEVHKFDAAGNFIETFTLSIAGTRDLAYDGQYFWGAPASGAIHGIDASTNSIASNISTSGAYRAIAYDSDNGGFLGNNWSGDVTCYDYSGTLLYTIADPGIASAYGMAYEGWSDNGPYLWTFEQNNGTGDVQTLRQIEINTGDYTGLSHDVTDLANMPTDGIAGGLYTYVENNKVYIGGLMQGSPCTVFEYYLFDVVGIDEVLPTSTTLYQNYPNPFNPSTSIKFYNAMNGKVNLTIYNAKGEVVKSLINGEMAAGMHTINFDAAGLNSGVYFYTIKAPGLVQTKKMIMVK